MAGERDGIPACKPAILNKERYWRKQSTDQYVLTNTNASFVKSSVWSAAETAETS